MIQPIKDGLDIGTLNVLRSRKRNSQLRPGNSGRKQGRRTQERVRNKFSLVYWHKSDNVRQFPIQSIYSYRNRKVFYAVKNQNNHAFSEIRRKNAYCRRAAAKPPIRHSGVITEIQKPLMFLRA